MQFSKLNTTRNDFFKNLKTVYGSGANVPKTKIETTKKVTDRFFTKSYTRLYTNKENGNVTGYTKTGNELSASIIGNEYLIITKTKNDNSGSVSTYYKIK